MNNCPRCNSRQAFAAKRREKDGQVQVYIGCNMCRWEQILYSGTAEQVEIKQDIDKLKGKVLRGDPLDRVLKSRQARLHGKR